MTFATTQQARRLTAEGYRTVPSRWMGTASATGCRASRSSLPPVLLSPSTGMGLSTTVETNCELGFGCCMRPRHCRLRSVGHGIIHPSSAGAFKGHLRPLPPSRRDTLLSVEGGVTTRKDRIGETSVCRVGCAGLGWFVAGLRYGLPVTNERDNSLRSAEFGKGGRACTGVRRRTRQAQFIGLS